MLALGSKVTFRPPELGCVSVEGKIIAIHWSHRWFSVEYGGEGIKLRTSFSFNDIGSAVNIKRVRRANKNKKEKK